MPIVCEYTVFLHLKSFGHLVCQIDKLRNGELFWSAGEKRSMLFKERRLCRQHLFKRDAQHLTTLAEDRLDDAAEQLFVAAQVGYFITRHADDGTLYLGRRIEDAWFDGEEILHMIPCLNQYGEDAILLVARLRGHAQGHFVLDHTRATGNEVFVVEHLEEYLRGDVVGIVACQDERLSVKNIMEIHPQEVSTYYIII